MCDLGVFDFEQSTLDSRLSTLDFRLSTLDFGLSTFRLGPMSKSTITVDQRRALLAASLGWMLDSMDVMLYSMVLTYLMRDLAMSTRTAGLLGSVTLVSSAIGGIAFG